MTIYTELISQQQQSQMSDNSVVSLQIHSYTLIASLTEGTLRLTLQVNHNDEIIYVSSKYNHEYFPQQLQIIFQTVGGFYDYLYKIAIKNMGERVFFRNGLLVIKVFIDEKIREIPIRMRKMREEKENHQHGEKPFMLTSIASEPSEAQSRITSKVEKTNNYHAPRLKLMMLKDNNKAKKALTKVPQFASSSNSQAIRQYPYVKPQTINRYDTKMRTQNASPASRKSYSEGKSIFNHQSQSRSFSLRKSIRENNMDLSNKDLKHQDVKEIISYDWSKLILLNLGYNNIGNEGLKMLTSIKWPVLKTLYVCFNNILKIQWTPANICFLKTLSLSGNKIKQIPKNIIQLQFLQQFFIYNNKIELLPEQLVIMQELKNFSIYGNKLDATRNKKVISKLKQRKVQVWE